MQSIMDRFLGPHWRTTMGGCLAAAGGVLAASTTGRWQVAGQVASAVGIALVGLAASDKDATPPNGGAA